MTIIDFGYYTAICCSCLFVTSILGGCWHRPRLCCHGRNMSCASLELPGEPHPLQPESHIHAKTLNDDGYPSVNVEELLPIRPSKIHPSSTDNTNETAHLGLFEIAEESSGNSDEEELAYLHQGDTHSVPVTVEPFQNLVDRDADSGIKLSRSDMERLMSYTIVSEKFVSHKQRVGNIRLKDDANQTSLPAAATCYCDEDCRKLEDCCSDYDVTCPARDCEVTNWTPWDEQCETSSDSKDVCTHGVKRRRRFVTHKEEHGGRQCPHLEEEKSCSGPNTEECRKATSEVSIVLPYEFGKARTHSREGYTYYDHPGTLAQLKLLTGTCITFEVTWISPQCKDPSAIRNMTVGAYVCAECQPSAKLPHEIKKCTGEGREDIETVWISGINGHCHGYWRQRRYETNCDCIHNGQELSFILV